MNTQKDPRPPINLSATIMRTNAKILRAFTFALIWVASITLIATTITAIACFSHITTTYRQYRDDLVKHDLVPIGFGILAAGIVQFVGLMTVALIGRVMADRTLGDFAEGGTAKP